jgi:hypothetical protein
VTLLDVIAVGLFLWTLIALPVFLLNWFLYIYRCYGRKWRPSSLRSRNKAPMKSTRAFLIPIATFLAVCELSTSTARQQVRHRINSLGPGSTVSVNGAVVQNPSDVLDALNDLRWERGHHSHPTKKIGVVISDQSGHVVLTLARDSENPKEYWVFLPKYWITSKSEVGRIKTSAFDNY